MKRSSFFCLALVALAFVTHMQGCPLPGGLTQKPGQLPAPAPPARGTTLRPGDYFPSKVGSTWSFQGEGNEFATFSRRVVDSKGTRVQIQDTSGEVTTSVFEVTESAVTRILHRTGPAGLDLPAVKPEESVVFMKAPVASGTKWTSADGDHEIVDTGVTVATPAATFNDCVAVKIAAQDGTRYEYYKAGVGLVKREFVTGQTKITSALKSYAVR